MGETVPIKLFFLVAGYDYDVPRNPKEGLDFQERCRNRLYERIDALERTKNSAPLGLKLPTRLRFLLFDIVAGKIEFFDHDLVAGPMTFAKRVPNPWKSLSKIKTFEPDPYDPNTFVSLRTYRPPKPNEFKKDPGALHPHFVWGRESNPDQIMSIKDIYKSVRGAPPGSILELSFFSHSYTRGPLLVNSPERKEYKEVNRLDRDPQDLDGRGHKDLQKTMGEGGTEDLLALFKKAFDAENGRIRLWGCLHSEGFKQRAWSVFRAIPRKLNQEDPDQTPLVVKTKTMGTLEYPLGSFLRWLAETGVILSYNYLAANTGICTIGSVPGPGSEDEKTGARLMRINKGHAGLLNHYGRFLSIKPDERLYGIYDQKTVERVKTLLAFTPRIPDLP